MRTRQNHRRPTKTTCGLDLRSLAIFRITFMSFYLFSLISERIPDLLHDTRSENFAPVSWIQSIFAHDRSSIFLHDNVSFHIGCLSAMVVLSICVLIGIFRTPSALLLFYLDHQFINRNPLANDEHPILMNRMFLVLEFTRCDQWWSCKSYRSNSKINYALDRSWGSVLLFATIVMLWLQIGVEKILEFDHWWIKGDAIQYILVGNYCVEPFAPMLRQLQSVIPRFISRWLCRSVVLLEFPAGPLMLLWPDDRCRMAGLVATGTALVVFGTMLKVGLNFPGITFIIQLALLPTSCMNQLQSSRGMEMEMEMEMETEMDIKDDCMKNCTEPSSKTIDDNTLPDLSPDIPLNYSLLRYTLRHCIHGFLGVSTFTVIFYGVLITQTRRPMGSEIPLLSQDVDAYLVQFGSIFSLNTGWMAGTPPPRTIRWNLMIGAPVKNKTWSIESKDPNVLGVHVKFQETLYDAAQEGNIVTHTSFWKLPPNMLCAGHRQFSVWKEKYYSSILAVNQGDIHEQVVALPKERVLRQACRDFHTRHVNPGERLASVSLYSLWQDILDPYSQPPRLSNSQFQFIGESSCD